MSIAYNQTSTPHKGLVQFYEKEIGANYGDVSGNSEALDEFTSRVGTALDRYLLIWAKNSRSWQADDSNHVDSEGNSTFQIITTNIVSGRRDYQFTTDENSNRIIDVSKVLILPSSTATRYVEITPVDETDTSTNDILTDTTSGVPTRYGKMGNTVLLDYIPNYNKQAGIKMVVNREGSYPTTSWTIQNIGVPAFHEYFYLRPAYEKASILGLSNLSRLEKAVVDLEGNERLRIRGAIADFFSQRERDVKNRMSVSLESANSGR